MEIIINNLTPHEINIIDKDGKVVKTFPSDGEARATQDEVEIRTVEGIPIIKMTFGEPVGLPEPSDRVFYIVSVITAKAAKSSGRTTRDLFITGKTVRNDKGQIIGCQSLCIFE
ncbi:MAG: hypothetical protein HXL38_000195 [Candidatus Saccharimonas sp.]|nr:MAG: hypothetical protein HXL38_000195 [Candidatus Saccharimonas sp.]